MKSVLLAVFAAIVATCNASDPVLSIVGPKVIVQGEVYKFAIAGHNLRKTLTANIKLSGTSDNNGDYRELNLIDKTIVSNELKNYFFNTKKLMPGSYNLTIDAYDPLMKVWYHEVQALTFRKSQFSIFIHTDKAIYKAGDLVRFRVFAIDSDARPVNPNSGDITIYDTSSSRVASFSNISFVKGKYENFLQLSASPTLGIWKISVTIGTDTFEKEIEVEDYVLPTYSVTVDVPSSVAVSETNFPVTITALYTFGQSVQGTAVVSFKKKTFQWWLSSPAVTIFEKTVSINSESVTFLVNMQTDLKVDNEDQSFDINVVFTETLTRKTAEASSQIQILQFAYSGVFEGKSNFNPNTLFDCKFSLRKYDGTPAPLATTVIVTIIFSKYCIYNDTIGDYICPTTSRIENYKLDASGSIAIEFMPEDCDYLSIEAYSPIASNSSFYVYKSLQNLLDLSILTANPTIGSAVNIKVETSSTTQDKCFCQMISKGVIVDSRTVVFSNQEGILHFIPTFDFAPTTQVICYFSNENGFQTQQISIDLQDKLPNFLKLELSSSTVKPSTNLSILVSSALKSTVSLLAIDQSVLLLKSGNEFSKSDVMNDFTKYNNIESYDWWALSNEQQMFESINLFLIETRLTTPENPYTTTTVRPVRPIFFGNAVMFDEAAAVPEEAPTTSAAPTGATAAAPAAPKVRSNFVESFLWEDVEIRKHLQHGNKVDPFRGVASVEFTAPDSITSYIFSGVSMNTAYGLGLPDLKPSMKVFLPFFIQMSLPNAIKRGEILVQDIIIFNYLPQQQTVTVSVNRNDVQFDILEPSKGNWQVSDDKYWQEIISLPNQPIGLKLVIKANILGVIDIDVTANGPLAGDKVHKTLNVIPEGIKKTITQSVLLSKNESNSDISITLNCTLPPSAVSDTTSASASVVGDLLGDMLNNLDNLIQMSYGCGEQNMLNFVPNIVALIYLTTTGKITDSLKTKAVAFAIDGYQRELTYRRNDGSFSAFGQSDSQGSTWLTAYVIKSFVMARQFIFIDSNVIKNALDFLISKQNSDGSFREDGRVIHTDMQGGSSSGFAMTAYISIVLSEILPNYPEFIAVRNNTLNYIVANIDSTNVYDLSISCYALFLAGHSEFRTFYDKLIALGIETGDLLRWEKPIVNTEDQSSWWWASQPRSNDIEISGYALESVKEVDISKAIKVAKYLVSQKNAFGGYGSSQDTVVGIKALADFSILITILSGSLKLVLTPDLGPSFTATVNSDNLLTLQSFALDPLARQLSVFSGEGSTGTALVSLSCNFYELVPVTSPRFKIGHSFIRPCKQGLTSHICLSFIATEGGLQSTGMVIMHMTFLSGYVFDTDTVLDSSIKKLEQGVGGSVVDVYFDSLSTTEICFNLQTIQTNVVENQKVASIEVTDYYDTTGRAQIFYSIPDNLIDCADLPVETTVNPDTSPTTENLDQSTNTTPTFVDASENLDQSTDSTPTFVDEAEKPM